MAGAVASGKYRNVFAECGIPQEEIDKRVEETFQTMFHGSEEERIFHEAEGFVTVGLKDRQNLSGNRFPHTRKAGEDLFRIMGVIIKNRRSGWGDTGKIISAPDPVEFFQCGTSALVIELHHAAQSADRQCIESGMAAGCREFDAFAVTEKRLGFDTGKVFCKSGFRRDDPGSIVEDPDIRSGRKIIAQRLRHLPGNDRTAADVFQKSGKDLRQLLLTVVVSTDIEYQRVVRPVSQKTFVAFISFKNQIISLSGTEIPGIFF